MAGGNPRAVISIAVMAAAIGGAIVLVVVNTRTPPTPPPVAPVFPKPPEAHPVIPSPEEEVQRPAQAFCEARDIALVSMSLRNAHRGALAAAKHGAKNGASASCHATDGDRDLTDAFNNLTKRTGVCVSRDSDLDGQWAQLDSSVLALGRCIDCTHPQADRLTGCQHMIDLVNSAEKSMR